MTELLNNKKKRLIAVSIFAVLTVVFLLTNYCFAAVDIWGGQKDYIKSKLAVGTLEDPKLIALNIVRVALGFIGLIAVVLIIYAGFIWMTSGGDEAKIDKAKQTLKNTVIGLIIIISAFGIVSYIINKLASDLASGGGIEHAPAFNIGIGALGSCSVKSVYPEPGQKEVPRNTGIIVTFREEVAPATICKDAPAAGGNGNGKCDAGEFIIPENVRIYKTGSGDACETTSCDDNIVKVNVSTNDNKTFVFMPKEWLGSPSEYIWHSIHLSNDILKIADGKGVFSACKSDYFEWQFEVSNKIDLEPPQVLDGGVFPAPDNLADEIGAVTPAAQAAGKITVDNLPLFYKAAVINSITPQGVSPTASAVVDAHCQESGILTVAVNADGVTAQLSKGTVLLGSASFSGATAVFNNFFTITAASAPAAGNAWDINIAGEQQADNLAVGNIVYVFIAGAPSGSQIKVGATVNITASNIASALAGHSAVAAVAAGNIITITAKTAGAAGNNILLSSNNNTAFSIIPMAGGSDKEYTTTVKDRKDKPKNSVVQINFNEAVNPMTVSGNASDVADYIKIINAKLGAIANGGACAVDNDCLSFKCDAGLCVKDYLAGNFFVSNQYRTVEFISDNLCGVNGCGENIYCLPGSSNIKMELNAAALDGCAKCETKTPYNFCNIHCQDSAGKNYPLAAMPFSGVTDMAFNSLDGNRDADADGPADFYYENAPDPLKGDNYSWSFFISDIIDLAPPQITAIKQKDADAIEQPLNHGSTEAHLANPVIINFSKLMMSSSLATGAVIINNGKEDVKHQLINIWSLAGGVVGYWTEKINIDSTVPPDGEGDWTEAFLKHSMFADTTSYRSQAGSGVKDIYQNCYKPSTGPGCVGGPSCCGEAPNAGSNCP